jgi:hypothetical protein
MLSKNSEVYILKYLGRRRRRKKRKGQIKGVKCERKRKMKVKVKRKIYRGKVNVCKYLKYVGRHRFSWI